MGEFDLFFGGMGMDYRNYAGSTVSQKIIVQFCFRFVVLFVVCFFFKPLQYFGAPENIKK